MRIVSGEFRGKAIATPPGDRTRPTSDRARQAGFNVLVHRFDCVRDARVLDAFAGSGALGLEALSRGAEHATFLDNDPRSIRLIGENIAKLREVAAAKVVRADATRPPPGRAPCDLLFLDPPYRSGLAAPALAALAEAGWLTPGAIATIELAHNEDIVPPGVSLSEGFEQVDERRYGAAKIVILRRTT